MSAKMTPAERAYAAFASRPLAARADRASFCAGYDTAMRPVPDLIAALQDIEMTLCAPRGGLDVTEACVRFARAALAKVGAGAP